MKTSTFRLTQFASAAAFAIAAFGATVPVRAWADQPEVPANTRPARPVTAVDYKTVSIDRVKVFYREAGPKNAPVVLLLHGFPTSSHMFRDLIPKLADKYHVIAPDYPGYGQSDQPPMLIVWGTKDKIFPGAGATPYLRDLPKAELHLLDTGHFALEEDGDQIAGLMHNFLDRKVKR